MKDKNGKDIFVGYCVQTPLGTGFVCITSNAWDGMCGVEMEDKQRMAFSPSELVIIEEECDV